VLEATGIAVCIGVVAAVCLACGFWAGLAVHGALSVIYKRNANLAVQRAYNEAKQQFIEGFKAEREKVSRINRSELPKNAQEAQDSFEEGLANLWPQDPAIQEAVRKEREAKSVIPKD
jgi:hypothetical protein